MPIPKFKITKNKQVWIFNGYYVARIYNDKIIIKVPYVKWLENSGNYAESNEKITNKEVIEKVITAIKNNMYDEAWGEILYHINEY